MLKIVNITFPSSICDGMSTPLEVEQSIRQQLAASSCESFLVGFGNKYVWTIDIHNSA